MNRLAVREGIEEGAENWSKSHSSLIAERLIERACPSRFTASWSFRAPKKLGR